MIWKWIGDPRSRLNLTALLCMGTACSSDGGNCPELTLDSAVRVESGEYQSLDDWPTDEFPPRVITVDVEAGTVEVRYLRDGKKVVETWVVTGSNVQ